jgi:hypothetical protein
VGRRKVKSIPSSRIRWFDGGVRRPPAGMLARGVIGERLVLAPARHKGHGCDYGTRGAAGQKPGSISILRGANPVRSAAVGSVALPSRRMTSAVFDAVIVTAAGLGLRRLRG